MKTARIPIVVAAFAASIASLASAQTTKPAKHLDGVVLGYVPAYRDHLAQPKDFNFGAFSHLCRAFLRPQADGTFKIDEDNYFDPEFEKAARAAGVKLLMSVGGEAKSPDRWLSIARDETIRARFLDGLAKLFAEHQYDGVDIDWEPPPATDADGRVYLELLKAVRARFPDKLLTIALSPKNYANEHLPLAEVVPLIDYYNAMAYDFSGPWTGTATFASNLDPDKAGANATTSTRELMTALVEKHHVPPAKIVMGMTFWGNRFRVDKLGDSFPKNAPGYSDSVSYPGVLDLIGTGRYDAKRDDVSGSMYLVRKGGGAIVTYDDPQSVKAKSEFAKKQGFAGVMTWNAYADLGGGQTPLLDAMSGVWGAKPKASPAALRHENELLDRAAAATATTPAQAKALNEKLRHARGLADDDKWTAAAPATTQPAAK